MASKVIKAENFEPAELKYGDVKKTASGGKTVYLNTSADNGLIIQTPYMKTPFGIKTFEDEGTKWTLELSFNDTESSQKFLDSLNKFDDKLLNDGVSNSLPWFSKKDVSVDVLKALYTNQVRLSRDKGTGEPNGKYPPTFRIKIPFYDGKFNCKVFDENKEQIQEDLRDVLVAGCEVKALVQCTGLWFVSGKYGCTWKAKQLIVKRPQGFNDYAFIDSDEEDVIDDTDQCLIESDDDEPEPVPVKKTRKSRKKDSEE